MDTDDADLAQVEAAAMAIHRWLRYRWQPEWDTASVTTKGKCRLIAWAALTAAKRAIEHEPPAVLEHGSMEPMDRPEEAGMAESQRVHS